MLIGHGNLSDAPFIVVECFSPKAIVDKITLNVNTGREIEEIGEVKTIFDCGVEHKQARQPCVAGESRLPFHAASQGPG